MGKRKTVEEKKLEEWKKVEKKFLGKIRKDKKRNEEKKISKVFQMSGKRAFHE